MITSKDTQVNKSFHGWIAETTEHVGGKDWQITTMKRHNGKVASVAQQGKLNRSGGFSFAMFGGDKSVTLISETGRATEKSVREQHAKALILFDENEEIKEEAEKEVYTIKEGQILFLNGYGQNEVFHERKAVYKIEESEWGTNYHTVNLETLELAVENRPRPIEELFGIGIYYKKGDTVSIEEVTNAVIDAKEKEAQESRKKESEKLLNDGARAAKIEEGKAIVKIPANAETIIIAKLMQDDSDPMTDYFASSSQKVVYLAYSSHKRNLFPEMRKAADKFNETNFLGTGKGIFEPFIKIDTEYYSNGAYFRKGQQSTWHDKLLPEEPFKTLAEAEKYIAEKGEPNNVTSEGQEISFKWDIKEETLEHRENYSMGAGYYLGTSRRWGWKVSKENYIDLTREDVKEMLYIAAAEGRYFADTQEEAAQEVEEVTGDINIIDYSEKAIAVYGDTKPVKDTLKALGGRFNFRLTHPQTGENLAGWIFPKAKAEDVKQALNL